MPDIHARRKISQRHTLCRNSLFSQSSQGLAGLERADKSKEEQERGCLLLRLPQISCLTDNNDHHVPVGLT